MWRGEDVSREGKVIRVIGARMNFRSNPDIPVLIAARGHRMLRLAGEIADVAHMASWFINVSDYRANLASISTGAQKAGRTLNELEIDVSIPVCISEDRERARRAARRLAGQAILWMAGKDQYSRNRPDWHPPTEFSVPPHVIEALRTRWNMWAQPQLPDELAAMISDDILDQFAVAGNAEECADRLVQIVAERPEATGLRIQAHPPAGSKSSYDGYAETVRGLGVAIARCKAAEPTATGPRSGPASNKRSETWKTS
jgi:alkanesulfonate monooxygenase SsuD/methylene tetrahydromethanopterin reductase-like flavin-dependent oxidoreductase (luciferase family)